VALLAFIMLELPPTAAPVPPQEVAAEALLGLEAPPVRSRGAWWPSVFGVAAAVLLGFFGYELAAAGVGVFVLVRTLLQFVAPERLHALESALTRGVGFLVAYLLLTPVWLLFFVPLGLATRRRRRMYQGEPAWHPCVDEGPEHVRWS
jgi:hypothetical protein